MVEAIRGSLDFVEAARFLVVRGGCQGIGRVLRILIVLQGSRFGLDVILLLEKPFYGSTGGRSISFQVKRRRRKSRVRAPTSPSGG